MVVVGVGTPESGRKFSGLLNPPLPAELLYVDPERQVYSALGLYSGVGPTFLSPATPAALKARGMDAVKEATKNYTMIAPPKFDDALQQGGLIVVGPSGEVAYAWRDAGTADHAPVDAVLAAARSAVATAR